MDKRTLKLLSVNLQGFPWWKKNKLLKIAKKYNVILFQEACKIDKNYERYFLYVFNHFNLYFNANLPHTGSRALLTAVHKNFNSRVKCDTLL